MAQIIGGIVYDTDGEHSDMSVAANQPASTATTVAALKDDFNALLSKLKEAGIMLPDEA